MSPTLRLVLALVVLSLPALALADEAAPNQADKPCACKAIHEATTLKSGDFELALHSRVQMWGGWVGANSLLENGDRMQEYGFRLRRARFGIEGQLVKGLTYGLELDVFDDERAGGALYSAFVAYAPCDWSTITAGVVKFPFSKAEQMSSRKLAHLDRAVGTYAMSPGNTTGLTVGFEPWQDHLFVTLGVFNGLQRKAGFHQGYEGVGVTLGNRFERLSYAGRVDLEPLDAVGSSEADIKAERSFRFGIGGGGFFNDGQSIRNWGASGYLHLKAFGAHLFAEALYDHSEPREKPTSLSTIETGLDRLAVQGSLGYMILPKLLGLAARCEYIDDNQDLDNEGDEMIIAGTLTWYAVGHFAKVVLEYQHRRELNGQALDNDHVIAGVQLAF